jgi:antitoxin PrlF
MPTAHRTEVLTTESTLTNRGQTTIPSAIRRALNLAPTDKLRFSLCSDNTVVLSRGEPEAEAQADPMIDSFLALLERDATANPTRLRAVPASLVERARALTEGVEVDLDAPLSDDDE